MRETLLRCRGFHPFFLVSLPVPYTFPGLWTFLCHTQLSRHRCDCQINLVSQVFSDGNRIVQINHPVLPLAQWRSSLRCLYSSNLDWIPRTPKNFLCSIVRVQSLYTKVSVGVDVDADQTPFLSHWWTSRPWEGRSVRVWSRLLFIEEGFTFPGFSRSWNGVPWRVPVLWRNMSRNKWKKIWISVLLGI